MTVNEVVVVVGEITMKQLDVVRCKATDEEISTNDAAMSSPHDCVCNVHHKQHLSIYSSVEA